VFGQYQSSILHFDDNNRLVYHSDEDGNRIPDFSHAGYRNGEFELPVLPVLLEIGPISGDNTVHIQSAIDQVSELPLDENGFRGAVLLKPGLYPIYGTLYIKHSGVVLRGSGQGDDPAVNSIIKGEGTDRRTLIEIGGNNISKWRSEVPGSRVDITSEYVPARSRTFEVADASKFFVGDNIIIRHPSSPEWLAAVHYGDTAGDVLWQPGEIDMYFNRFITRIEGNKIKVDAPIYHELDRSLSQSYAWIFTRDELTTETGIENLRVDIETAGPEDERHPWDGIKFIGVEDCWAQNVTVLHFGKSGFWLEGATRSTILDCAAIEPHSEVEPPDRYNFYVGPASNNVLFKGCHASGARHAFVSNGASSVAGMVFTNCSSVDEYTGSEGHRRWGSGFLWDNTSFNSANTYRVLGLYNRGSWGTAHGWTGTNQVAWNISAPNNQIVVQKPPIGQNYAIGCDATVDNQGPWIHPAGWIEGTGESLLIESLYETQLSERLTYGVGPDAPAKLKSVDFSFTDTSRYVDLEWIDIALDEHQYVLERSSDSGNTFEVVAILNENSESFTDTDIVQDNYYYRLKAMNDMGASAYSNLLHVDLLAELPSEYPAIQAEDFTSTFGCGVATNRAGYTGTGFVDMGGIDTWFEWDCIDGGEGGSRTLIFRYASSDTNNRQCEINVNGIPAGNLSFAPTGDWETWLTDRIDVTLTSGMNTIRVTANTAEGGPNIDNMEVTGLYPPVIIPATISIDSGAIVDNATVSIPVTLTSGTGAVTELSFTLALDATVVELVAIGIGGAADDAGKTLTVAERDSDNILVEIGGNDTVMADGTVATIYLKAATTGRNGQCSDLICQTPVCYAPDDSVIETVATHGESCLELSFKPGDVDRNSLLTASDIQFVINKALNIPVVHNCDINNDGAVNAIDVQLVINAVLDKEISV